MDFTPLGLGFIVGGLLGGFAVLAWIGRKSARDAEAVRRLETERDELKQHLSAIESSEMQVVELQTRLEEQQKHASELEERISGTFAKISQNTALTNSKQFLELATTQFAPFEKLLAQSKLATEQLEAKRVEAYVKLQEAAKTIVNSSSELRSETSKLETALRRPDHRGKWGEVGLRNVVEYAGMLEHCDFSEQVSTSGEQSFRPDMVVNVPGGGHIVVDSKLPLEHYLNAIDEPDNAAEHLDNHAKLVELHYKALAKKEYWDQLDKTPSFVVMFVNVESALIAALERNPKLHPAALEKNVLMTTPTTLLALLQAAAYGWRQEAIAQNAEEIAKAGQELFDRLSTFKNYVHDVGKKLQQANNSYNNAVSSFNTRLMPGAKRLSDLQTTGGKELDSLEQIDAEPGTIQDN